ncbi:hypothetical protein IWZ03DRAFT_382691 [Phyllosticta citriasiana]|uniref:Uncharacterized protein n=1 Tax=Phyllosticta citriasiana TaxID=595635 RepID=A0ABR1KF76_9PEZI
MQICGGCMSFHDKKCFCPLQLSKSARSRRCYGCERKLRLCPHLDMDYSQFIGLPDHSELGKFHNDRKFFHYGYDFRWLFDSAACPCDVRITVSENLRNMQQTEASEEQIRQVAQSTPPLQTQTILQRKKNIQVKTETCYKILPTNRGGWEFIWGWKDQREKAQKAIHEVITKRDYMVCPHLRGAYFSKEKLKAFYSEVTGGHNVQESSVEFICENELCGAKCEVSLVLDTNSDWRHSRSGGVWNPEPDYCLYITVSRRLELADMGGPEWLAKTELMEGVTLGGAYEKWRIR